MHAEEDDEIVKEIDVYISQNLAGNLSIFQYPLRQPWRKYPMNRLVEIKQRPGHQKVVCIYIFFDFVPFTLKNYVKKLWQNNLFIIC